MLTTGLVPPQIAEHLADALQVDEAIVAAVTAATVRQQRDEAADLACARAEAPSHARVQVVERQAVRREGAGCRRPLPLPAEQSPRAERRREEPRPGARPYSTRARARDHRGDGPRPPSRRWSQYLQLVVPARSSPIPPRRHRARWLRQHPQLQCLVPRSLSLHAVRAARARAAIASAA